MRNAYLNTLYELAKKDINLLSLVSDNGMIVYDAFRRDFPEQYFNFGISEAHMVTAAAGMAICGKIPFVYTISSFLAYRAYEALRLDICLQNLNVKVIGIGSGVAYGYLGPTHHTTEDIGLLRSLPNLTIFSPATPLEAKKCIEEAYKINGPVFVRLGTNGEKEYYKDSRDIEIQKGIIMREGTDIVIITTGCILLEVLEVAELLSKLEIYAEVININTLKPFDKEIIKMCANKIHKMFVVEEHNIIGGLGSIVAEVIAEENLNVEFYRIGLEDRFAIGYGTQKEVRMQNGLDAQGIYKYIISNYNLLKK